jgi:two-component SAPR family response regulator
MLDNQIRYRILVVDGEYDVALSYTLALRYNGYLVDMYTEPYKVISEFKVNFYDLALLDIRMPVMTGFELYEKLRDFDKKMKVCFITAFSIYYESLKEFFDPIDIRCVKPVSTKKLINQQELIR